MCPGASPVGSVSALCCVCSTVSVSLFFHINPLVYLFSVLFCYSPFSFSSFSPLFRIFFVYFHISCDLLSFFLPFGCRSAQRAGLNSTQFLGLGAVCLDLTFHLILSTLFLHRSSTTLSLLHTGSLSPFLLLSIGFSLSSLSSTSFSHTLFLILPFLSSPIRLLDILFFPMANKPSPAQTRGRKGSMRDGSSIEDIPTLIRESEERIKNLFKSELASLNERLDKIDGRLSSVQSECVRLDTEISTLKDIVIHQQLQLEKHEKINREKNIIINNIPEEVLSFDSTSLSTDIEKIGFLVAKMNLDLDPEKDFESLQRVGKSISDGKPKLRPIKISLKDRDSKFLFLNKRKQISNNEDLMRVFHNRIFVNNDSSFLIQREEFRLRQNLKELKLDHPNSNCYIRSGRLYLDGLITDQVDVKNQLF